MLHLMKALKMPSQTKLYTLPDGWMSKETLDGHNGFYHQSLFRPKKLYEQVFNNDGVATVYSDAWTKVRASRMTAPNLQAGTKRVLVWDFASLPAGGIADVYVLGKLFIGDRVLGGHETHSALTSGAGTATGSIGTYAILADGISLGAADSAARFLAATDWDGASVQASAAVLGRLAATQALGYGFIPTADLFLVAVNSVEAFPVAGVMKGHMDILRT